MNFQPVTPLPGIAGWQFLQRTQGAQRQVFDRMPEMTRDVAHFKSAIATVLTAEELVGDRQLLKVALGAFGLEDQLDKKFFIRKILEEGTESSGSLAIRLVDPRYRQFAEAFGFGNSLGPRTGQSDFGQIITDAYKERQFEVAVGRSDTDLRLALGFKREIRGYAESAAPDAAWFSILGSPPLRKVFETAFGLPSDFAGIDIDQQRDVMSDRSRDLLGGDGSVAAFKDQAAIDVILSRFLARAQIASGPTASTPGFAALSLLQSAGGTSATGQINLILSNS